MDAGNPKDVSLHSTWAARATLTDVELDIILCLHKQLPTDGTCTVRPPDSLARGGHSIRNKI